MSTTADLKPPGPGTPRDLSVFINCPYDSAYQRYFDALLFTVVCCGFVPCAAVQSDNTSQLRMQRILEGLRASRFSIHDLSRSKGEGRDRIARLNMAFELGIAHGMKEAPSPDLALQPHDWTAVVDQGAPLERAFSDLKGHDPKRYANRDSLVTLVAAWLVTRLPDRPVCVTSAQVIAALPAVDLGFDVLRQQWPSGSPPWSEVLATSRRIAATVGVI